MRQCTRIAIEQMHQEWTEYYCLARWLCRKKLVRFNGSTSQDIDEHVGEAIAHAWKIFPRLRERRPEFSAMTAIFLATRTGVSRVRAKTRFVPKPHRHYIDVMDGRVAREEYVEGKVPDRAQEPVPFDPHDRSAVESLIDGLPLRLQPVARLLSYGMSRRAVAESHGMSETTVRSTIHKIRLALAG